MIKNDDEIKKNKIINLKDLMMDDLFFKKSE